MKSVISTLITGVSILLGGLILMCFGFGILRSSADENPLKTNVTAKVDTITESFDSAEIDVRGADLEILPSTDGICSVTSPYAEKVYYTATVENGILKIWRTDLRKWYEKITFFAFDSLTVKVLLPEKEYQKLTVRSYSRNVTVKAGVCFEKADVKASSGDITYLGSATSELRLSVSSGDVFAQGISTDEIYASTTSGALKIENAACRRLTLNGTSGAMKVQGATVEEACDFKQTSGSISLSRVISKGEINAELTSGSLHLDRCDGESLSLKTTSGSIRGTLLSDMVFNAKATSGTVRVPPSVQSGGVCHVETTSGSINLSIEKEN